MVYAETSEVNFRVKEVNRYDSDSSGERNLEVAVQRDSEL